MVPNPSKSSPKRKNRKFRKGIEFQRLEDRILYSAAPAVHADAPDQSHGEGSSHAADPAEAADAGHANLAAALAATAEVHGGDAPAEHAAEAAPEVHPTNVDLAHLADASVGHHDLAPTNGADGTGGHVRTELLIVDGTLKDANALADSMAAERGEGIDLQVLTLNTAQDGLAQISAYLESQSELGVHFDALHIVSHAQEGRIVLGNSSYQAGDFASGHAAAQEVAHWSAALTADSDILLYGCDLASGSSGAHLIENLSTATGADVAASTNQTGSTHLGGDWILETSTGAIETTVLTSHLDTALAPIPFVTVDAPENPFTGESFSVDITFDNTSITPTDVGYGPFVDLRVSAGLDVVGGAFTYLTYPVNVLGHYENTGNTPMIITHPISQIAALPGTDIILAPGEEYYVLELPFGSFVPDQPAAHIQFNAITDKTEAPADYLPNQAGAQGTVSFQVGGGYRYGADPLDDPGIDPPIYTAPLANNEDGNAATGSASTDEIHPRIWEVSKTLVEKESEAATGPNDPQTWVIDVDVATGETLTNLDISDILANDLVYLGGSATISVGGVTYTPVAGQPNNAVDLFNNSTGAPGADGHPDNALHFQIPTLTGVAGTDATITYQTYVPYLDADGVQVLAPASGDDRPILNGVEASATYDPDGAGVIAPYTIYDSATGDPLLLPNIQELSAESLTIQKGVTDLNGGPFVPGDTLGWNLDFQVSDYYQFNDLFVIDHLGDGQLFIDSTGTVVAGVDAPTLTTSENGGGVNTTFSLANATIVTIAPDVVKVEFAETPGGVVTLVAFYNGTIADQTFDANFYEAGASGAITVGAGETILLFRLSEQMVAAGADAILRGDGLVGTSNFTPGMTASQLNTALGANIGNGQTHGQINFKTVVQRNYVTGPSGDISIDMGDAIDNTVTIDGQILDTIDDTPKLREADGSGASIAIDGPTLAKTLTAIDGDTGYSDAIVGAGESVTWGLSTELSVAAVEKLVIEDFVPLPKFVVSEFSSLDLGPVKDIMSDVVVYTRTAFDALSAADQLPPAGQIYVVLGDDTYAALLAANGASVIKAATSNSDANSFAIDVGTFDLLPGDASEALNRKVDIFFSLTATDEPMTDGLYLTNQQRTSYQDTGKVAAVGEKIVQVQVEEPVVDIQKGIVASSQGGGLTLGGIAFNGVAGSGFTGVVDTAAEANAIGASDLITGVLPDGGDVVRYALVVQNTGRADAFDVTFKDSIDYNLFFDVDPDDLHVGVANDKADFIAATNFEVRLGNGVLLTEGAGADYVLTYNADLDPNTGDFQIELTDGGTGKLAEGKNADGTLIAGGLNTIVVTYDLTLATNIAATQSYTNTATLTNYTGLEGSGKNRVPGGDTDTAIFITDAPDLVKNLVSTEVVEPGNAALNQATIGELITYDLVITVPEGTTNSLQLIDSLSSELGFYQIVSVTPSSLDISTTNAIPVGGFSAHVTQTGHNLTIDFGTVTNNNADNNVAETITVRLQAVVLNVASNQSGDTVRNQAHLVYDPGAVGTGDGSAGSANGPTVNAPLVTIVEPTLAVTKQVENVTDSTSLADSVRGDAGDIIRYTITITNNNAASDTAAYELWLKDQIPAQLPNATLSIVSVTSTGTVTVGAGTLTNNFEITAGNFLQTVAGADIDIQKGSSITIVVEGTFSGATGSVVTNQADIRWTSLDGDPGDRDITVGGTLGVERTGDPTDPGGVLNDYTKKDTADITSPPLVNKILVDTSQSATSGTDVAIGEVVRYRLITTLAEGTAANGQIRDNLGDGLMFLNDGTARFAFVSDTAGHITSTAITDIAAVSGGTVIGSTVEMLALTPAQITGTFGDSNISTVSAGVGTGDPTIYSSGQDIYFRFGDLQNLDNDLNSEYLVIEFNVLVANVAGNQAGSSLLNSYSVLVDIDGNGTADEVVVTRDTNGDGVVDGTEGNFSYTTSNEVNVDVVEPNIGVAKLVTATDGAVVTYQVTLTNTGTTTAFDTDISDVLDGINLKLNHIVSVTPSVGVTGITNHPAVDTVSYTIDSIPVGGTVTITYQANVLTTPTGVTTLDNTVHATTTSLNGTSITSPFYGTVDTTLGAPGTATGERTGADGVGGALNDYADADTVSLGSIGDQVWFDANGNALFDGTDVGIPGATVTVRWAGLDGIFDNGDDSVITTLTNASGLYSVTGLPVDSAGQYRVSVDPATAPFTTFGLTTQTYDADGLGTANSSIRSLTTGTPNPRDQDFGYTGNASLGDQIWHDQNANGVLDAGEQGIPQVTVNAVWLGFDGVVGGGDDVAYTTTTDSTGNYLFSTLPAGNYTVSVDTSTLPDNFAQTYDLDDGFDLTPGTPNTTVTTLAPGQVRDDVDFAYTGNSSIGDTVWYDVDGNGSQNNAEPGIAGALVTLVFGGDDGDLSTTIDNITYTTTTDATGNYLFSGLFGGDINGALPNYRVTVTPPAGYTTQTYDADGVGTANTSSLQLPNTGSNLDQDFGYRGPVTQGIGDFVWEDLNGNGRQDAGEPGIVGVAVNLLDATGNILATTTTGAGGDYAFSNLVSSDIFGDYRVSFVAPVGMVLTAQDSTVATDATDSDADTTGPTIGRTGLVTVAPGAINTSVDAGYYTPVKLGDRVFFDLNGDGVQDAGETGISGVTVDVLWLGLDGVVGGGDDVNYTTTTGVNGIWSVDTLPPGSYQVTASAFPNGFTTVTDSLDNGVLSPTNSVVVSTTSGVDRDDIDFGLVGNASIGDRIWHDQNADGSDVGEQGIPNVTVNLTWYGQDGVLGTADDVITSTVTDSTGYYLFSTLPAGDYTVTVDTTTLPDNFTQTSDPDSTLDSTTVVTGLAVGDVLKTVDFGYKGNGTIGDRVWFDVNGDGIQDASEPGLVGVTVTLVFGGDDGDLATAADNITYTTTTTTDGIYSFTGLFGGDINGLDPNYRVIVTPIAGSVQTYDALGALDNTSELQLPDGGTNNLQDFGYIGAGTQGIGNFVWDDLNGDGIQDLGEPGLSGVKVELWTAGTDGLLNTADDQQLETTVTGAGGIYSFTNLFTNAEIGQDYQVRFEKPVGSVFTLVDQGGNDAADSDATETGPNIGRTGAVTVTTGAINDTVDAGFYVPASVAGKVYADSNRNGIADLGESGIAGVTITLTGTNDLGQTVTLTTLTDADGNYIFDRLRASDATGYTLTESQPAYYYDGLEAIGSNGGALVDNDVIGNIVLGVGDIATAYDFGEIPIPPVIPVTPTPIVPPEVVEETPGVLDNYFYNSFENFRSDDQDEDQDYLLDAPYMPPEAILPIMPLYSGHAEPGSTIVIEIRNVRGAVIGSETVLADAGGNWLAKFPNSVVFDTPTSVTQTVSRPSYASSGDSDFNFRNNYSPAENPSHFFTQNYDVDQVFSETGEEFQDLEKGLKDPQNFGWSGYNYEFLAAPGVPSS